MIYLGDFPADQAIYFMWNTNDSNGASITRSVDGTLSVYKDNSDGSSFNQTQVTTGITNDEDVDGLTGVHSCCITTTNAWYETGHDYTVVLSAATINAQTVNVVIATFSIENRHTAAGGAAPTVGEIRTEMEGAGTKLTLTLGDTDELQGNQAAWATAVGFSTHSAADVWSVAARVLTANTNFNDLDAAAMKAEVVAALADIKLDHLLNIAVDTDWGTTVHLDSVIGHMADVGGAATYDRANESMEALRARGDAAWITATGFSTHTAANVKTAIEQAGSSLAQILADTNEMELDLKNGGRLDLILDIIAADTTTDIPAKVLKYIQLIARSDAAIATDNATELTAINADGGSGAGDFSNQTDAEEAIRDRGDAAWSAAAGTPSVLIDTTINVATDQTHFTLVAGSDVDDAYKDQAVVIYDVTNSDFPSVRKCTSYTGATKTVTLDSAPDFTIAAADKVKVFVTAPGTSAPSAVENAMAVWDRVLTGATHNIATSAGRRVREIGAFAIESGTAQAGNGHSITLAASASADDGVYNRNLIVLVDNTGVGQTRTIVDYDGTSKVVVVDRDWRISPDATTAYQIVPDDTPLTVDHGVAVGGTATTITIRPYASSTDDAYLCNIVTIIAGKGRGQARLVGAYDGTSNVVTICGDDWVDIPDTTSIYVMMPYGVACAACVGDVALAQIKSEVNDAISDVDLDTHDQNMKAILFSELV